MLIGGMPAVVSAWVESGSLIDCSEAQQALLSTYRDDFSKYAPRIPPGRLARVLDTVPRLLGRKFKYSLVDRDERSSALKHALDLLCKARLCHRVVSTDGAGVPLAAGERRGYFKVVLLDTGMVCASLGVSLSELESPREALFINEGGLAEQVVGQVLRTLGPRYKDARLFCWAREKKGSEAELDYLLQHGARVVPVEVKAGSTGSLKSMHLFMSEKKLTRAIRINADMPSSTSVAVTTTTGQRAQYQLLSLPFYLAEQAHRFLDDAFSPTG